MLLREMASTEPDSAFESCVAAPVPTSDVTLLKKLVLFYFVRVNYHCVVNTDHQQVLRSRQEEQMTDSKENWEERKVVKVKKERRVEKEKLGEKVVKLELVVVEDLGRKDGQCE